MRHLLPEDLRPGRQLSREFLKAVLGLYLVLAVLLTLGQLMIEYDNEKQELIEQVHTLAGTFTPTLSEALWNYDEEQIQVTMQGMYSTQEVAGVVVQGNNEARYSVGRVMPGISETASENGADTPLYDRLYRESFTLSLPTDNSEYLGELVVFYSSSMIINRTYKTFVTTVFMAIIKTTGLWVIAMLVFRRFVGQPVSTLQKAILEYDIDSTETPDYRPLEEDDLHKANELYVLNHCFMALTAELANKNAIVEEHTNNLENLVREKTTDLENALEELQALDKIKSEFLARMSHEMRTPLNSIIGFATRIQKSEKDNLRERSMEALKTIESNGEHLVSVVSDLLDISKIEAGKMELNALPCKLPLLVQEVAASMEEAARAKNLKLIVDELPLIEAVLDTVRFRQILFNLISNAIKYTDSGEVRVRMEARSHESVDGVMIEVADTGVGIAEHDMSRLFNTFEQLGFGTNSQAGSGLGLAVVKELVGLFGGFVSVESTPGEGSVFSFWVPLNAHD